MQQPKEIKLKHPIEHGGAKIEKLVMRGPKVRDLINSEKASGNNSEREVYLFAVLCDVAEEAIHELEVIDYEELQEAYKGFLS